jgi:hypothetical protein
MTLSTNLYCESCSKELIADFSGNVWCENKECLLNNKSFSWEFIEARAEAKKNKTKMPTKQHMPQIGQVGYS